LFSGGSSGCGCDAPEPNGFNFLILGAVVGIGSTMYCVCIGDYHEEIRTTQYPDARVPWLINRNGRIICGSYLSAAGSSERQPSQMPISYTSNILRICCGLAPKVSPLAALSLLPLLSFTPFPVVGPALVVVFAALLPLPGSG